MQSACKEIKTSVFVRVIRTLLFVGLLLSLVSCGDPVTNHKILSTLFDGVPSLPPPGQICEDYYEARRAAELGEVSAVELADAQAGKGKKSQHRPYVEKKCNDCHDINNKATQGFIVPKQELCGVCHEDFAGQHVHGPVAVGDCLACHLPHSSTHTSLLIESPGDICQTCHAERRLAANMHERFVVSAITCNQCHDPHAGDARYFLK
ncbi:MAG: cytochrome C [Desulfuromonas sp.]|nr:MAG: cytochrome C [Desulfuromonas sp.]